MSNGNDKEDAPPPEGMPPEGNGMSLDSGKPSVAAAPGKTMFLLLGAAIFLLIVIKALFFSSSTPTVKPAVHHAESVPAAAKPVEPPPPPPLPPPEKVETPPLPSPPPLPQASSTVFSSTSRPNDEALNKRVRSNMVVASGSIHGGAGADAKRKRASAGNDPNSQFADSLEDSTTERVEAKSMADLNATIAQGKFIPAVMESAVISELPGELRAIVSHDVYAESGKNILIPKGSRLIGVYNSATKKGQGRVFIIWTRVIRPDGIDVAINSPGVDALGRAGQIGYLDDKYFETFANAILTSALDLTTAVAGAALIPNGNTAQTTTTNSNGTTTTTTPSAQAVQQGVQTAVSGLNAAGQTVVSNIANIQPSVSIDQGTVINVFVNKDLVFPTQVSPFVQW